MNANPSFPGGQPAWPTVAYKRATPPREPESACMDLPIVLIESPKSPNQIEALITLNNEAVVRYAALADGADDCIAKGFYRDEARKHAATVAELSAQRAPETVAEMERVRGLL